MSSSSCHIGFAVDFIASSSACSQREQEKGARRRDKKGKRNHVLNTMSAIIGKCKRKQKRENNSTKTEEYHELWHVTFIQRFRTFATKYAPHRIIKKCA